MKKIIYISLCIELAFFAQTVMGQSTILKSGAIFLSSKQSRIAENDYNLLKEYNYFNSYGIQIGGGLRQFNGLSLEGMIGYSMNKWRYSDRTSEEFTNGLDRITLTSNMNVVDLNLGISQVMKAQQNDFGYIKMGLNLSFIQTGNSTQDIGGTGNYTLTTNYGSSIGINVAPELGLFLKSTSNKEMALFARYDIGMVDIFNMSYDVEYLTNKETYDITSKGNAITVGLKYTLKTTPEKKEKTPKEPKTPKPPKEKIAKEPKEKKEKEKELKVDKDGIPKSLKDRKVEKEKSIYVSSTEIVFKVWDSGKEIDGDTISLNLNGDWIIENFGLEKEPHEIKVSISPDSKNFLMLFAINQGKFPPNTAAISVWDGEKEQKLELKSTLNSCGALNIVYRPK